MTADELAALSERAARILTGGGGMRALAQLLAETTGGAVLIEDDQWRHLALAEGRAKAAAVPPSFAPYYRKSIGASPTARKKRSRAYNSVVRAHLGGSLTALCAAMPGGGGEDGTPAGYVTLFIAGKQAPNLEAALRIVASAAGVECIRRGAGRTQAARTFWERFLGSGFSDLATLRDEALAAGIALPPTYVAAVFDVEGVPPATAREMIAQALASAEALCPLVSAGQVVALFPARHQTDLARARQAAGNAVRDLPQAGAVRSLACGLGGHHADLLDVPTALAEARQALVLGLRLFGRNSVTMHADLGVFALLDAGGSRETFQHFADSFIEPLLAYDRKHKTDLLKTLRLYLEVGENIKEAAERLFVHRHTIFYRLNQIAQILKVDLRSPKDQLSLRAALAIRQMHHEEEA